MTPATSFLTLDAPLILASRSPRRIALLRELGLPFEVFPSDVQEQLTPGERPDVLAMEAARLKAEDVARRFPDRLVLGADTVVYLDDRMQCGGAARCAPAGFVLLGKPADRTEARAMLRALRNRWHGVVTGLCLTVPGRVAETAVEATRVRMSDFSDEELERYLATDEPLDKAGAYGIQGEAARLIEAIDGDYYNVVGLPLRLFLAMLGHWVAADGLVIPPLPERFAKPADQPD